MEQIKEIIKDMNPVQIMEIVNVLVAEMSNKGALVHDDADPEWFIHHLEYREEVDEIFFIADTPTIAELYR